MVFGNRSIAYSRALSIAFKAQKKITFQFEYPSSIDLLFIRAPKGLSQSDGKCGRKILKNSKFAANLVLKFDVNCGVIRVHAMKYAFTIKFGYLDLFANIS